MINPQQKRKEEKLREMVLQKEENLRKECQEASPETHELNIPCESSMERVLEEIIAKGKITGAAWTEVRKSQKWQIIFTLESGLRCDRVTQWLNDWGIGYRDGSTVTLTPCTVHNFGTDTDSRTASQADLAQKEGIWEKFVASVTARLNVAQLVDQVRVNAEIRFDFVTLIIVAA